MGFIFIDNHESLASIASLACLQAVCGCLYRGKTPENAEFAIAGAVLDARESRSGASDKSTGRVPLSRPRFVTRPRPIFACVQDGAKDRELCVFRGFPALKTPTNRLEAG